MLQRDLSDKQIESIVALNPIERYEHTIKQVVGWGKLWALYHNGWALIGDNNGIQYLPLWPAKEYAALCGVGEWKEYNPKAIELDDFLQNIASDLIQKNIFLAIFITPDDKGVTPSYEEFVNHISRELDKY